MYVEEEAGKGSCVSISKPGRGQEDSSQLKKARPMLSRHLRFKVSLVVHGGAQRFPCASPIHSSQHQALLHLVWKAHMHST